MMNLSGPELPTLSHLLLNANGVQNPRMSQFGQNCKSIRVIFDPHKSNTSDSAKNKPFSLKAQPKSSVMINKNSVLNMKMLVGNVDSNSKNNLNANFSNSRATNVTESSYKKINDSRDDRIHQQDEAKLTKQLRKGINTCQINQSQQFSDRALHSTKPFMIKFGKKSKQKLSFNAAIEVAQQTSKTSKKKTSQRPSQCPITTAQRDQEFRHLYGRLKVHYILQNATYKNMSLPEKYYRSVQNLESFEKELTTYLANPDANQQARLVLKDVRSKRADMVTKLAAYVNVDDSSKLNSNFQSANDDDDPLFKLDHVTLEKSNVQLLTSKKPMYRLKNKNRARMKGSSDFFGGSARKALWKLSGKALSKRLLTRKDETFLSNIQAKYNVSNRTNASSTQKSSQTRESLAGISTKLLASSPSNKMNKNGQSKTVASLPKTQSSRKWRKNDFINLLPHPGEIPKNVSQTLKAIPVAKKDPVKVKGKASILYTTWLEEIVAQKLENENKINDANDEADKEVKAKSPSDNKMNIKKLTNRNSNMAKWASISKYDKKDTKSLLKTTKPSVDNQKYISPLAIPKNNLMSTFPRTFPNLASYFLRQTRGTTRDVEDVSNTIKSVVANATYEQPKQVSHGSSKVTPVPKSLGLQLSTIKDVNTDIKNTNIIIYTPPTPVKPNVDDTSNVQRIPQTSLSICTKAGRESCGTIPDFFRQLNLEPMTLSSFKSNSFSGYPSTLMQSPLLGESVKNEESSLDEPILPVKDSKEAFARLKSFVRATQYHQPKHHIVQNNYPYSGSMKGTPRMALQYPTSNFEQPLQPNVLINEYILRRRRIMSPLSIGRRQNVLK